MGLKRKASRILVGKRAGRGQLGRPRRRWSVILKWLLKEYYGERGIDSSG
jgi:hypothetical protein